MNEISNINSIENIPNDNMIPPDESITPPNNSIIYSNNYNKIVEVLSYLLISSIILLFLIFTSKTLFMLQKNALKDNFNYIPSDYQDTFKENNNKMYWKKELNNINTKGFYSGNDCYRFYINEEGYIFFNNIVIPIGEISKTTIKSNKEEESDYIKYINNLINNNKPFIIEFRKKINSLIFYINSETLLIDKIFQLKETEFIGERIRKYYLNSFKNFLYDLNKDIIINKDDISINNPIYKQRLEIFKYLIFNGVFNNYNFFITNEYIFIYGIDFQLFLKGCFKKFIKEIFLSDFNETPTKYLEISNLLLENTLTIISSVYFDKIEFLIINKENNIFKTSLFVGLFNKSNGELFSIKFKSLFGFGPQNNASKTFKYLKKETNKYKNKWIYLIKENNSNKNNNIEKDLVTSFYGESITGWEFFDKFLINDLIKKDTPQISGFLSL